MQKNIYGIDTDSFVNEDLSYDDTEERREDAKLFGKLYDEEPLKKRLNRAFREYSASKRREKESPESNMEKGSSALLQPVVMEKAS